MSERTTTITGPSGTAMRDWDYQTRAAMIRQYRRYYLRQLEQAMTALAAGDDQLVVSTERNRVVKEVTE